jgi:hypothetical protein
MIVQNLETNTEAPFLGKEGEAMLTLLKAQIEWSSRSVTAISLTEPDRDESHDDLERLRLAGQVASIPDL